MDILVAIFSGKSCCNCKAYDHEKGICKLHSFEVYDSFGKDFPKIAIDIPVKSQYICYGWKGKDE